MEVLVNVTSASLSPVRDDFEDGSENWDFAGEVVILAPNGRPLEKVPFRALDFGGLLSSLRVSEMKGLVDSVLRDYLTLCHAKGQHPEKGSHPMSIETTLEVKTVTKSPVKGQSHWDFSGEITIHAPNGRAVDKCTYKAMDFGGVLTSLRASEMKSVVDTVLRKYLAFCYAQRKTPTVT